MLMDLSLYPSLITPKGGIFAHNRIDGSNRFQQAAFAARVLVTHGSVLPPVPVPPIRGEPDLLDRIRRGIRSIRPAFLLPSPPQDVD